MKKKYSLRFILFFALLGIFFSSCNKEKKTYLLKQVIYDSKHSKHSFNIKYDNRNRIISWNNTDIIYMKDKIIVGKSYYLYDDFNYTPITFTLKDGRAIHSSTMGMIEFNGGICYANKEVDYVYNEGSITITANYSLISDSTFIGREIITLIYNKKDELIKRVRREEVKNKEPKIFYTYLNYEDSIHYKTNYNMLSFVLNVRGSDIFFYLLLNLDACPRSKTLPSLIRYEEGVNKKSDNVTLHYRMDGDLPSMAEIINDSNKIESKINLRYDLY